MRLWSQMLVLAIIALGGGPARANWGIPLWCEVGSVTENGHERPGDESDGFSVPLIKGNVYVKEDPCMYYRLVEIRTDEFVLTCYGPSVRAVLRLDRHSTAFHRVMTFTGSEGESEVEVAIGDCHITSPPLCCALTPEEEERERERVEREFRQLEHGVPLDEDGARGSRIVR